MSVLRLRRCAPTLRITRSEGLRTNGHELHANENRSSPQPLAPSQNGFTLLEVMVAITILALGIVTALELLAGSLRLGTKASRYTQAAIYAQSVMDRLFAQSVLEDGEESGELPGGYIWQARVQEIYPDEDETRTRSQAQQRSPTDFFHLKEIEVNVRWAEGSGQQVLALRSLRTLVEQPTQ
ncbi:MAG: type IV pilus modification PilV family protein [Candidatus Binatia bacterium]